MIYLLRYWYFIAIVLLAAYIEYIEVKNTSLTTKINEQAVSMQVQENTITQLKSSLDDQNSAIQQLKQFQENKAKKSAKELQIAKDTANEWRKKAAGIMSTQKPANKSSCDAANDLINETIK